MSEIDRLLGIMAQLRDPSDGCPWDVEQTFASIAPYTIEEAYEVADAIARNDLNDLRDELGDLLLQIVFHARMAEEAGEFTFDDVVVAINDKMVRRHPHVFTSNSAAPADSGALNQQWEAQKARERADKTQTGQTLSALDGVALNLPALTRATKIQKRAHCMGFDWQAVEPVVNKVEEELAELLDARIEADPARVEEEMGDFLFAAVNLARHVDVDPETALRQATVKFSHRFTQLEALASQQNLELTDMDMQQLDALWNRVKQQE